MSSFLTNRRQLFVAAGALATAPILRAAPARAAIDPAGAALRAVHRFSLGGMKISVIDDARFTFPAPMFAVNQPEGTVAPFLEGFGLPGETVSLHMQMTLVETGGRKVLLDTGMGDITFPGNAVDNGRLFAGLAVLGVAAEDITDVIISHGHPDHIGACSIDGAPAFPNATYHIPPEELEFWTQKPGDGQDFMSMMLAVGNAKLEPVRALTRPYKDGDEIAPGVFAVAAPGHTIAHHAILLSDGGEKLLHLMDTAVHYLVGPEQPDWAMGVEMDVEKAAETRRRLFRQAAEEKFLVAGYHFPFPGVGRIVEQGAAWRYVPMQTA
jgi:glyoxylase-like metal-dependent hydrolase (beta-lactamase superfamily II)